MTPDPKQRLPRELLRELIEEGSEAFRGVLEKLINAAMQLEREEFLGARRWERSEQRRDHANGYKDKTLSTRVGQLRIRIDPRPKTEATTRTIERATSTSPGLLSPIPGTRVPFGEGAQVGHRRDVCNGRVDAQGHRDYRAAVRHRDLRQPGLKNLQAAGRRTRAVSQPPFGQLSSCVPGCALREGPSPGQHSGCGRLESDRSQLLGQAGGDWGQLPTQRG